MAKKNKGGDSKGGKAEIVIRVGGAELRAPLNWVRPVIITVGWLTVLSVLQPSGAAAFGS